jgi:hypothetical protein
LPKSRRREERVALKAGWGCSQRLAPVVEEEAMDVRPRTEEKKNGKTSKIR